MAPFRRGKAQAARIHGFQIRGGKPSGRGGRRGRPKPTFHASRIEEQAEITETESGDESLMGKDTDNESMVSLQSDGEDHHGQNNRPYQSLLRSLKTQIQHGESPRKKPKLGITRIEASPPLIEEDQSMLKMDDLEGASAGAEDDSLGEDEDLEEKGDPFHSQFTDRKDGDVDNLISDVKHSRWRSEKLSGLVGLTTVVKEPLSSGASRTAKYKSLCVKESLREPSESVLGSMDELQKEISAPLFHYRDAFFTGRQTGNAKELRDLAALHALNHVLKTRNKVLKGNIKAAKDSHDEDFECRDQGFTRPKVLVILPTKQSCVKYIDSITTFAQPEQVENKKQFQERFVQGDDEFSDDKPSDFKELFGGNDDDMFRMGLKLTRKTMKYFSNFYTSDMIFASPLGLRMALDSDNKKEKDHDFLSSVEILIIDQADAILMQNWEHIEYIMEHINLQPSEAHGCDFSRVRSYYLDGNAKYFRQTIVFSGYNFPQLNRLYTQTMLNVGGKVKFTQIQPGAIIGLSIQVRQTFSRFETSSPASDPEDRFTYLTTAILPTLTRQRKGGFESQQGVLLYIPLYADFVRLRNHLATSASTQNISFGSISEYTPPQDVSRARSHFLSGRHSILLYTERAHHFRRYRIRGVQRVIMFGLPENPLFYKEIVGGYLGRTLVEGGEVAAQNGVRGLFSRFDLLKLERIVGTERFAPLLKEKGGDTFDFT